MKKSVEQLAARFNTKPDVIEAALNEYDKFLSMKFNADEVVKKFTYKELNEYITEDIFEKIPEIEKLNHTKIELEGFRSSSSRYHKTKPDYDYIDLGALARNMFYMICRDYITQPL